MCLHNCFLHKSLNLIITIMVLFMSRLSLIVRVNVVLNRTVVVDSDGRFNNLCGSNLRGNAFHPFFHAFFQAMGRIFVGLCQVGAWGCFDEFNRLEERMLSAVSQQVQTIQQSLKEGSSDPCKPTTYTAFFFVHSSSQQCVP